MIEQYTLDNLTQDSVSVKKEKVVQGEEGKEFGYNDGDIVGEPWRCAYINSINGREQVQKEVPEPYRGGIFAVWGDSPTMDDIVETEL